MSDKTFTPGPWTYRTNPNCSLDLFGGGTALICNVRIANQEANARLISAAPELLEALATLVKRIEFYSSMKDDERPNIEQWEYTEGSSDMAKARAAILKATGAA